MDMNCDCMSNSEMDERLRPIEAISYPLASLIRYAVFSGVGQSYTVEQKKDLLQKVLRDVEFRPQGERKRIMEEGEALRAKIAIA
jgi:hypothetical protein